MWDKTEDYNFLNLFGTKEYGRPNSWERIQNDD
jgi:hypothetical protein